MTQLAAGLVAIFSLRELSQRSQLFRTALLVILTYAAIYFAFELMTENGLSNDFSKLNLRMYTYFIINGVLLLFAYPLLFLLEKTFGFTSNVTLVELSNINNDLLRQMSETVPGNFQHSMQVEMCIRDRETTVTGKYCPKPKNVWGISCKTAPVCRWTTYAQSICAPAFTTYNR